MTYEQTFFKDRRDKTLVSSRAVLEQVWNVFQPVSVLDIGCATGIWLTECQRRGVDKVCGVDGPWVPREDIEIAANDFMEWDLGKSLPSDMDTFEMALCVEVAEHLPEESSNELVRFLTGHADAVLFSAAIPGQGGTGHINEKPQSYWYERFRLCGFECYDLIRPRVWNDPGVNVIYKQNMLLYVRSDSDIHEKVRSHVPKVFRVDSDYALDRVHPDLFHRRLNPPKVRLPKRVKRLLVKMFGNASSK